MKQGEHNWEVTGVKELFLYPNIYPSSEIRKSEDMTNKNNNCPFLDQLHRSEDRYGLLGRASPTLVLEDLDSSPQKP